MGQGRCDRTEEEVGNGPMAAGTDNDQIGIGSRFLEYEAGVAATDQDVDRIDIPA